MLRLSKSLRIKSLKIDYKNSKLRPIQIVKLNLGSAHYIQHVNNNIINQSHPFPQTKAAFKITILVKKSIQHRIHIQYVFLRKKV